MASSRYSWCLEDFRDFAGKLELPSGGPLALEPFQDFILGELFAPGRVEVVCLLPKGQGKTTLLAALAVFHLLTTSNAECFIGAADTFQADEMYRFAAHFIESEPELEALLLVRKSTREIRSRRDQGFLRVLASDTSAAGGRRHSFNPTLALLDEVHAHPNDALYVALRSAAFKRGGLVATISTAGHDKDSTLGRLRRGMLELDQKGGSVRDGLAVDKNGRAVARKSGRLTVARAESGRTVMLEWACREDDDLEDAAVVKLANPASFVTLASMEDAREIPGITEWAFARYRANRWTTGYQSWLPARAWDALAEPDARIPDGVEVVAALDFARFHDEAALVWLWCRDGAPPLATARVWASVGDDPIEYEAVMDAVRSLQRRYELRAVGYDPRLFDKASEELAGEGAPMVQFDQTNARMCPASAELRRAILSDELRHDGDPVLAAHVAAGVMKDVGPDMWRLTKVRRRGAPIDALIALAMAHDLYVKGTNLKPDPAAWRIELI